LRREPLTWGLGLAFGVMIAIFQDAFHLAWGLALALPLGTAVLALGLHRHPTDPSLHPVLRSLMALVLGYLLVSIALTSSFLARQAEASEAARESSEAIMAELIPRWITMFLCVPIAGFALWRRSRILRAIGHGGGRRRRARRAEAASEDGGAKAGPREPRAKGDRGRRRRGR